MSINANTPPLYLNTTVAPLTNATTSIATQWIPIWTVATPYNPNYCPGCFSPFVTTSPPVVVYYYSYIYYCVLLLILVVAVIAIKIAINKRNERLRQEAARRRRACPTAQNAAVVTSTTTTNNSNDNNGNATQAAFPKESDLPPAYDDIVTAKMQQEYLSYAQESAANGATGNTATASSTIPSAISTLTIETDISSNYPSNVDLNHLGNRTDAIASTSSGETRIDIMECKKPNEYDV